ncbi:MAG: glycosyltransferase family 2 protein [Betaproteobacteria bacterium]|nr:glycosyltransferase family 2 protein [Betaproteobacteria bacterium]
MPPTLQLVRENRPADAGAPPLITVVVCAYRHAAYIDECLASVDATAPGVAIELIVIDDGSPDDTLARCLVRVSRTDLRLRIYTKPNQGLVHSLHCGLARWPKGRYFAVMASDDSYGAGGSEQVQAALLASESPIGALLCQAVYLAEHGNPIDGRPVYGQAHAVLLRGSAAERLDAVCTEYPKPLLLQASVFETRPCAKSASGATAWRSMTGRHSSASSWPRRQTRPRCATAAISCWRATACTATACTTGSTGNCG